MQVPVNSSLQLSSFFCWVELNKPHLSGSCTELIKACFGTCRILRTRLFGWSTVTHTAGHSRGFYLLASELRDRSELATNERMYKVAEWTKCLEISMYKRGRWGWFGSTCPYSSLYSSTLDFPRFRARLFAHNILTTSRPATLRCYLLKPQKRPPNVSLANIPPANVPLTNVLLLLCYIFCST